MMHTSPSNKLKPLKRFTNVWQATPTATKIRMLFVGVTLGAILGSTLLDEIRKRKSK